MRASRGKVDRIFGVQRVLPVLAAARLVVADDEAAHFLGVALARVRVDGVEHGARGISPLIVLLPACSGVK